MVDNALNQNEKAKLSHKRQCLFALLREDEPFHGLTGDVKNTNRTQVNSNQTNDLPGEVLELICYFANPTDSMEQLLKLR